MVPSVVQACTSGTFIAIPSRQTEFVRVCSPASMHSSVNIQQILTTTHHDALSVARRSWTVENPSRCPLRAPPVFVSAHRTERTHLQRRRPRNPPPPERCPRAVHCRGSSGHDSIITGHPPRLRPRARGVHARDWHVYIMPLDLTLGNYPRAC